MFQPLSVPAARVVESLAAHRSRTLARANAAAATVRANGGSAMDAAKAAIGAGFDEAAAINDFKVSVLSMIRLGTGHPAVRARYGARAEMLSRSLDVAIIQVEHWYRAERKAFQISRAFGGGSRLSVEVLGELRLILRLIRRSPYRDHFPAIVDFMLGADWKTPEREQIRRSESALSHGA
jgi:hypothetical protein